MAPPVATANLPSTDQLYRPGGGALRLFHCRDREVLLAGPAGTGKSLACLWKLHFCLGKVPRVRALAVRKTRVSLAESGLVTYETKVLPRGLVQGPSRQNRQSYVYGNGSELIVGGLDKSSKIFSTEFDLIFVQEATELTEDDWENLTTRLRNAVLPFQQILADCNPDKPQHWLKLRCDVGKTRLIESRHEDNPAVTPEYLSTLDALSGPRKERLRYGRWVTAEGVVYDGYDAAVHVVDRFDVPLSWPRYWAVDFGFVNPFVWQCWARDPDGRLYLEKEIYHTGRLVEDHARRILHLSGALGPGGRPDWARSPCRPRAVVCDHDAEDLATLERYLGLGPLTEAPKEISPGIQTVQARLRPQGDGKPRLFLLRDALDERDPVLAAAKKPCCTAEEFDGYVWDVRANRRKGEVPLDRDDHGMDALRYVVFFLDGKPPPCAPGPQPRAGISAVERLRKLRNA